MSSIDAWNTTCVVFAGSIHMIRLNGFHWLNGGITRLPTRQPSLLLLRSCTGQAPSLQLPYLPHKLAMESIDRSFNTQEALLAQLKQHLSNAVNRMKQFANQHRSVRCFKEGDYVFLKLHPHRQVSVAQHASKKLSPRYFGPFQIIAKVGEVAYTLQLPAGSRVHPTFHVSLLKLCPDPTATQVPLPNDVTDLNNPKEPFAVLDRRVVQRHHRPLTQVLIHWTGGLPEEAMWESWEEVTKLFPQFVEAIHP